MGRNNANDGQELTFDDLNKIAPLLQKEIYDRVVYEMLQRSVNAFFGDGLKVGYVGSALVSVNMGSGFQTDNTQVDPEGIQRLVFNAASANQALSPPHASLDRIDIICVKAAIATTLTQMRKYKATPTSTPTLVNLPVQTDWQASFSIVTGTPNASPVVPSTPAGYLKLAEVLVHAVTGVGGAGDITDRRTLMPVGGNVALNTLGAVRVTAGSAVPISQLISDIDTLLKFGYFNYLDLDVLGSDPAVPAASRVRFYQKSGVLYTKDQFGSVSPLGAGGGGGAGAEWWPNAGLAPVDTEEYGQLVYNYGSGLTQKLTIWLKVPTSYLAGRQVNMKISQYSPSAANTMLLTSVATLIRKGTDAMDSVTNQRTSTNTALTNTVAKQLRESVLDLSSATGQVNGVAISPGDVVKVELSRGTDTDTADVRFVPSATEVLFG